MLVFWKGFSDCSVKNELIISFQAYGRPDNPNPFTQKVKIFLNKLEQQRTRFQVGHSPEGQVKRETWNENKEPWHTCSMASAQSQWPSGLVFNSQMRKNSIDINKLELRSLCNTWTLKRLTWVRGRGQPTGCCKDMCLFFPSGIQVGSWSLLRIYMSHRVWEFISSCYYSKPRSLKTTILKTLRNQNQIMLSNQSYTFAGANSKIHWKVTPSRRSLRIFTNNPAAYPHIVEY